MRRLLLTTLVVCLSVAAIQAHALYLLRAEGQIVVVFSDELAPDARVKEASWKKVTPLELQAVTRDGKVSTVKTTTAEARLIAKVPDDVVLVHGHAQYGFSNHGGKARLLHFYMKGVFGASEKTKLALGADCKLEVVPMIEGSQVRFQVLSAGKPVGNLDVSVMIPGEKTKKVNATTNAEGLTKTFSAKGRYGVTVRQTLTESGQVDGQAYEEVMNVATLVVDVK